MYRSEQTARQRLDAATRRAEDVRLAVERLLLRLGELDRQLSSRFMLTTKPPVLTPPAAVSVDVEASVDDLDRMAATVEAEVDRYEGELKLLERLVHVQHARLSGQADHLPLGPAPRDVPRSYLWSEWFSPQFSVAFCSFIVLASVAVPWAPLVGILAWPLCTVGIVIALVRTRRAAKRRVEFLRRCRVVEHVRVAGFEPGGGPPLGILEPPHGSGWDFVRRPKHDLRGYWGTNTLSFENLEGRPCKLRYRGAPYGGHVVLHDDSSGETHSVGQLHCRPRPNVHGQWVGGVTTAARFGLVASCLALLLWTGTGIAALAITACTVGAVWVIPWF